MEIKVLIVDDDPRFRELVADIMKKQGYQPVEVRDGQEAIETLIRLKDEIDLVILDVMMPVLDGWEVLKALREFSEVPVIMLTALGDDRHVVFGLEEGADDYISKPFSYEVFVARVKALLRKAALEKQSEITAGGIRIVQVNHKVFADGREVELNRKEYNLLLYLIKNKNQVLSRDRLLDALWGHDFEGGARTIDTHVKTIRAKLAGCGSQIRTVRGSGYRFAEEKE